MSEFNTFMETISKANSVLEPAHREAYEALVRAESASDDFNKALARYEDLYEKVKEDVSARTLTEMGFSKSPWRKRTVDEDMLADYIENESE